MYCKKMFPTFVPKGFRYKEIQVKCGTTSYNGGINMCPDCEKKHYQLKGGRMEDYITSVEVYATLAKLDFMCVVKGSFLTNIYCYINKGDEAKWKTDRFDHEEQLRFLRMVMENYGVQEINLQEYAKKIMICFENGIECILK